VGPTHNNAVGLTELLGTRLKPSEAHDRLERETPDSGRVGTNSAMSDHLRVGLNRRPNHMSTKKKMLKKRS
jgi:hypothetical protein